MVAAPIMTSVISQSSAQSQGASTSTAFIASAADVHAGGEAIADLDIADVPAAGESIANLGAAAGASDFSPGRPFVVHVVLQAGGEFVVVLVREQLDVVFFGGNRHQKAPRA